MGAATISPIVGNHSKLAITQLFFSENAYDVAKQLLEFLISHYGANGASAFYVLINEIQSDLINLFLSGCGFRQCSAEETWEVTKRTFYLGKCLVASFPVR